MRLSVQAKVKTGYASSAAMAALSGEELQQLSQLLAQVVLEPEGEEEIVER